MIEEIPSSSATGVVDDAPGMNNRAESAMDRLEDDFRHVLVNNTVPFDSLRLHGMSKPLIPPSQCFQISPVLPLDGVNAEIEEDVSAASLEFDGELDLILVHPAAINELKKIADRMITSGYEKECSLVYSSVRSHVLDECLRVLGIEKYSIEDVKKMEWTTVHDQMENWMQALKILVKRILINEKFLCEKVFDESESLKEVCFVESAKGCVLRMLNFGKALVICKRSSDKLFTTLHSYDALSDVMPDLEELFDGDSGAGEIVCREAKCVLEGFCAAVTATLVEFEGAVLKESSASRMLENGDIHPFTQYVMNYVKLLVDYSEILNGILEKTGFNSMQLQKEEVDNVERKPCITNVLLSLIKSLESNLDEQSRMYEDAGLQSVFLMNNVLYIVNKLKETGVRNMLGDRCISERRDQIRQYALSYLRASWTKALNCLNFGGLVDSKNLKVKLRNFNEYFENTHRIQTTWFVADPQLRDDLRIMISEKIIQMYRTFVWRFEHSGIYIKHSPEDLSIYLGEFFEGITIQRRNYVLCS